MRAAIRDGGAELDADDSAMTMDANGDGVTTENLLDRALELTKFQAAHIQRLEAELAAFRAHVTGQSPSVAPAAGPVQVPTDVPPEHPRRMAKATVPSAKAGRPWKRDPVDDRMEALLAERGPLPRHQLMVLLGLSEAALERSLRRMKFAGRIVCVGSRSTGRWTLPPSQDRAPAADPEEDSCDPGAILDGEANGSAAGPIESSD